MLDNMNMPCFQPIIQPMLAPPPPPPPPPPPSLLVPQEADEPEYEAECGPLSPEELEFDHYLKGSKTTPGSLERKVYDVVQYKTKFCHSYYDDAKPCPCTHFSHWKQDAWGRSIERVFVSRCNYAHSEDELNRKHKAHDEIAEIIIDVVSRLSKTFGLTGRALDEQIVKTYRNLRQAPEATIRDRYEQLTGKRYVKASMKACRHGMVVKGSKKHLGYNQRGGLPPQRQEPMQPLPGAWPWASSSSS